MPIIGGSVVAISVTVFVTTDWSEATAVGVGVETKIVVVTVL